MTVLAALGAARFTLVGCSLGGVVGLELYARAGARFDALVTLGSFARYPDGERVAEGIVAAVREAGSMAVFGQRRAAQLGLPPQRTAETIEQMACKSVPCYIASTQATWTGDYTGMLSSIVVPALIAYGERDTSRRARSPRSWLPASAMRRWPRSPTPATLPTPIIRQPLTRSYAVF